MLSYFEYCYLVEVARDPERAKKLIDYVNKRTMQRVHHRRDLEDGKIERFTNKLARKGIEDESHLIQTARIDHRDDKTYNEIVKRLKVNVHKGEQVHKVLQKNKAPVKQFPINKLQPLQTHVDPHGVKQKIDGKGPGSKADSPITVLKYKGSHYVMDGHHRYMAARARGDTHINAHYHELHPVEKTLMMKITGK